MNLLGRRSDVGTRAPQFEAIQEETLSRLASDKAQAMLGERALNLTSLVENAKPVGVNRRGEIVLPKRVDVGEPLCLVAKQGEKGIYTFPTAEYGGTNEHLDGYRVKSTQEIAVTPLLSSGYAMTGTISAKGLLTGTLPMLVKLIPKQQIGYDAATLGHETEHWRFMAEQDFQKLGNSTIDITFTASERMAYQVNAAIEPSTANAPSVNAIVRAVRRKNIEDPVQAVLETKRMIRGRSHTIEVPVMSWYREALAYSEIFGDGSFTPTELEARAYGAAGLINAQTDSDY